MANDILKDGYGSLPAGWRHAISLATTGGMLVVFFFLFIREPLAQASAADGRQDVIQQKQQTTIDKMSDAIVTLTQTQAVQTGNLANLQRNQDRMDQQLNRIEDKIDRLRQGR